MEANIVNAPNLAARFLFGLRVEVKTTKQLHSVLHYLEKKMPRWRGEKWDYRAVTPLLGVSAVGLSSPDSNAVRIHEGCVTVCFLVPNENTISFTEFEAAVRKRGPYRKVAAA